MTKFLFTGVLACTVALAASPSIQAGERQVKRVVIDESPGFFWASGNAGDVFNSQGRTETIWCSASAVANYAWGQCFARDEKGQTLQCVTEDELLIRVILGISGDSTIAVSIRKEGGRCARIDVVNGSYAAPKRQTIPEDAAIDTSGVIIDELQQ